jgi:hypothetical protein
MSTAISEALARLRTDSWRKEVGFSKEIEEANRALFDATDEAERQSILGSWLHAHQPCLFGKMAAKLGALGYCILTEGDLRSSDETIRGRIQEARREWRKEAFGGKESGFVILAVSEDLAGAIPDENTLAIAQRLTQLYLNREIEPDVCYHEDVFLEKPGPEGVMWKWMAGVNYFSAQGDRRWWQDHRIPGGIALSVNSVGHMIKSAIIAGAMAELDKKLRVTTDEWDATKVDSPHSALKFAMKTILKASDAVSGPATRLLKAPEGDDGKRVTGCPFDMEALSAYNCREYAGLYHTDITLPREYFRPDVGRPGDVESHTLDFTYLYDNSVENPDYITMGEGERVREDSAVTAAERGFAKVAKMEPTLVPVSEYPRE